MVSYIGDNDDIIATYQDLAKEYSISQPEFWQSTETDMMFIVWSLVAILMIVLNMIEAVSYTHLILLERGTGRGPDAGPCAGFHGGGVPPAGA